MSRAHFVSIHSQRQHYVQYTTILYPLGSEESTGCQKPQVRKRSSFQSNEKQQNREAAAVAAQACDLPNVLAIPSTVCT